MMNEIRKKVVRESGRFIYRCILSADEAKQMKSSEQMRPVTRLSGAK
jgi:hypothetical protein